MTQDHSATGPQHPHAPEITGGGVTLTLSTGQVYVELDQSLPDGGIEAVLDHYHLEPVSEQRGRRVPDGAEHPVHRLWLQGEPGEDPGRLIAELRGDQRVNVANPVYHRADLLPLMTGFSYADLLLVWFGAQAGEREIHDSIRAHGTEEVASAPDGQGGSVRQLRLLAAGEQALPAVVGAFARSELVRYAAPDWIQLNAAGSGPVTTDPLSKDQWNLDRIDAASGWALTLGSPGVVIAVIDSGCDLDHPDLAGKYVPPADYFDALASPGGRPEDGENHGSFTAGIAAAGTDNDIGVAGVAPRCRIMPIRLFSGAGITAWNILASVNWAREHGADIITMSWYYLGDPTITDLALEQAYEDNLVLAAASGNCFPAEGCPGPAAVFYPATHPRVMAVGGSSRSDQRIHPTGTDKDKPWERWHSRFGPELSVVAPGIDCWSTNNAGGYGMFYGTSAAAPHVAGLAALVLSVLGDFPRPPGFARKQDLVRYIIESTARKTGGYSYGTDAAHPYGGWNIEMGYGRIDVAAALRRARDFLPFHGQNDRFRQTAYILFGIIDDAPGLRWVPGGKPVPVDPGWGWDHLSAAQRDVLLGLATTELAGGIADPHTRQALEQAGWDAIARTAQQRRGQ